MGQDPAPARGAYEGGTGVLASPYRVVAVLAATTFLVEVAIMSLFRFLPTLPFALEAILDAGLLVLGILPVLILVVYQPLVREVRRAEMAEQRVIEANEHLESRVSARTAELAARTKAIAVLAETSSALLACTQADEAYKVAAHSATRLLPGTSGVLFVYRPSRNDLEPVAQWNAPLPDAGQWDFAPDDCWALRRGRPYRTDDSEDQLPCRHRFDGLTGLGTCIPMVAQGEVLGLLHLREPTAQTPPGTEGAGVETAEVLAESMALTLTSLRLRESLRNLSIRDPLTGLFNRRYLEETLDREVRRAERAGQSLGVIMLDLDHFKAFNDLFGHEGGDAVLKELGVLLKASFRGGDVACRYGGEEFALILPEAGLDALRNKAESLRCDVKALAVRLRGGSVGPVTASLGVAALPGNGTTGAELLGAADRALYRAKALGRDRVELAWAPSATPAA